MGDALRGMGMRLARRRAQRREERVAARHPVFLEHGRGITRDFSPSGVFFETGEAMEIGGTIKFAIDFETAPGSPFRLLCEGRVVRVEAAHGHRGVGAAITSSRIRDL